MKTKNQKLWQFQCFVETLPSHHTAPGETPGGRRERLTRFYLSGHLSLLLTKKFNRWLEKGGATGRPGVRIEPISQAGGQKS